MIAGFVVSIAIAGVTAFGAHYSANLPDVITWSDALSSFMLGFGLDQLRDTVSPTSSIGPQTTTVSSAAAASHAAARPMTLPR